MSWWFLGRFVCFCFWVVCFLCGFVVLWVAELSVLVLFCGCFVGICACVGMMVFGSWGLVQ